MMRSETHLANDPTHQDKIRQLIAAVEQNLIGKREVVEKALIALIARGHLLIEDVPGVGKTTLALSLAQAFNLSFQRIQFTSDLLPTDVTGVTIFNQKTQEFEFRPGPLFANIVLADEINRTTPKTQSSLLEAMQDGKVTVDGQSHPLPQPFLVLATQNPIEHYGTYPLPESQLDRFLLKVEIGYPAAEEESRILRKPDGATSAPSPASLLGGEELQRLSQTASQVHMEPALERYLLEVVRKTRDNPNLELGVSPRGGIALFRACQARALIQGRDFCLPDDVKALAVDVLSHRVIVSNTFAAAGERRLRGAALVIEEILQRLPVPL